MILHRNYKTKNISGLDMDSRHVITKVERRECQHLMSTGKQGILEFHIAQIEKQITKACGDL